MKYNKCLDFAALAIQASAKGKPLLAARFFARAATSGDAEDALRIIEASNGRAWEQAQEEQKKIAAAAKAAKLKAAQAKPAAKRVQAAEVTAGDDPSCTDEDMDDLELGADLVEDQATMEEQLPQESLAGDLAELDDLDTDGDGDDDSLESPEEQAEEDDAAAFAAVLASMQKQAGAAKVKAKK